ncbi:hypothetical protein AVEN_12874-1 [Araneus ventricosus]|uniref:Uncharacterized protein n=1 Tax=Araneus ventricosus TaxID=182803 RepID=A0A4Y1ZV66_ARAVE|nr:hypothetical protein AVEN_12874-1 [Araneus ventricosus]
MEEVSCTTSYELPFGLFGTELKQCKSSRYLRNPRLAARQTPLAATGALVPSWRLSDGDLASWTKKLHDTLQKMWNRRKRPVTLDEQALRGRVLATIITSGDMMKLASVLNKIADPVTCITFLQWMDCWETIPSVTWTCFGTDPRTCNIITWRCGCCRRGHVEHPPHEGNVGRSVGRRGCQ